MIKPQIRGDIHLNPTASSSHPFTVGDIDPDGSFIHVFDGATLDIILKELDTISDFTSYLAKKEAFIRSGHLVSAYGEEELVAYYMTHMNQQDEHDFVKPDGSPWDNNDRVTFGGGFFPDLVNNQQYISKKDADQISYVWDRLIQRFTDHMLAGTTIVPDGGEFVLAEHEQSIRYMALEPRYRRRMFGEGILDALEKGKTAHRFTRGFIPGPTERDRETGFFFMTLKLPESSPPGGYDQYCEVRKNILYCYALTFLRKYPELKRIVGIATEPLALRGNQTGSSEDLILIEDPSWTEQLIADLEDLQSDLNIAREGRYKEYNVRINEFPDVIPVEEELLPDDQAPKIEGMNRHERRALAAKARRKKKRKRQIDP